MRHFPQFKKNYPFYPLFIPKIILFSLFECGFRLKPRRNLDFKNDRKRIKEKWEVFVGQVCPTYLLLDIGDATMQNFYKHFRQMLYEGQLNTLKTHFEQKPKTAKMRRFFDIPVYFYLYDDELFVVDKPLKTKRKKQPHTKEESLRIKVLYSRLRRSINHSQMKQNLAQHLAEHIWRYGKEYKMLNFLY